MKTILDSSFVKHELKRLKKQPKDFEERCISTDIGRLKDALREVDKIIKGETNTVTINANMWEECRNSLDTILNKFNLEINIDKSILEEHTLVIESL